MSTAEVYDFPLTRRPLVPPCPPRAPDWLTAIERVVAIAEAGRSVRKDLLVICHGGPFDEPDQVDQALRRMPGINGFFGASSIERLPTERGIRRQVQEFKGLQLAK